MAKPRIGGKSKRVLCSKRYKIEKKVRQHNKKVKKNKEDKLKKHKNNKHKDLGVPNSCPFKQEILREAESRKFQVEQERKKRMEQRKKDKLKLINQKRNLETIVTDAAKRSDDFERTVKFVEEYADHQEKSMENSLKSFYREVKKVIDGSDVVIEVLDARDPLGSRCPQVEEAILSSGTNKKIVLLLNKIDLVPKENVENWLKYLRNEFPTVAFKACTQSQSDKLSHSKVPVAQAGDELRKSSLCLGADVLMTLLGNYCRSLNIKTAITIGIVGFPNTGKSSVINSLKRSKACNVGSTPGVTKTMQIVQLDKHIKLLDSPGVVMASNLQNNEAVVLHNCVRLESLEDPIKPVSTILSRCSKPYMMMLYNVAEFSNVNEFLQLLAKRLGKVKKGGTLDINKTAKLVIQDWNRGKIRFYTQPPETYTRSAHVSAEIVSTMSKEFDIEALLKDEGETLQGLKSTSESELADFSIPSTGFTMVENDALMKAESDSDEPEPMVEDIKIDNRAPRIKKKKVEVPKPAAPQIPGNLQMNKDRKKAYKKSMKQRRRADGVAAGLSTALTAAFSGLTGGDDDNYSFKTDY